MANDRADRQASKGRGTRAALILARSMYRKLVEGDFQRLDVLAFITELLALELNRRGDGADRPDGQDDRVPSSRAGALVEAPPPSSAVG
jgi:hypothetical protein